MTGLVCCDGSQLTAELLRLRGKGVSLWAEHGELHFRAPKGAVSRDEMQWLASNRAAIVTILHAMAASDAIDPSSRGHRTVPLTFTQLSHWNTRGLAHRRAVRHLASATRVCGHLQVAPLRSSLAEVIDRHGALRTRIVVVDDAPAQQVMPSGRCELTYSDVSRLPEAVREAEIQRIIEEEILQPIDVTADPLISVRLIKAREDEHVLIVALEHIISDAFSMKILLRDLFALYRNEVEGTAFELPSMTMQFADYAAWLRQQHVSWVEKHGAYWRERLRGCGRLRFPVDQRSNGLTGWGSIPVKIEADLKERLRKWSKLHRTTLVMTVFAAYVAAVLRWCGSSQAVFPYQVDGRFSPQVQGVIGYFASALQLKIERCERDSFLDLLNRVMLVYCEAHEHADHSYLDSQVPQPEYTRNAGFNWVPQEPREGLCTAASSGRSIRLHAVPFANPVLRVIDRDAEPCVLFHDHRETVDGRIYFPHRCFTAPSMEMFSRSLLTLLQAILENPHHPIGDVIRPQ